MRKRFLRRKFPLQCPTTGKDEAYLAAKITCKKDGYVFYKPAKEIKMPGSQYPMPPEEAVRFLGIKCPKCGSDDLKFDFPRKIEGSE